MNHYNHYIVMFFIMIISGLLSTMNMWVDTLEDIRFSINDVYMTLLMTGWMFLFMGLYYQDPVIICIGILMVVSNIWCIRTQFLVTPEQYILGMIPHHSMAVLMSKRLVQSYPSRMNNFANDIINTQEREIDYMKHIAT
jgi:hypothetical protein